jgi:hypothetical protein
VIAGWSLTAKGVLLAAVAVAGFVGGARWVQWKWDGERRERAEIAAEAERMARMVETKRHEGAQEALNGYARNLRSAHAAAAGARDELGRLRDAIASAGPAASDPAAAGRADAAGRLAAVAAECGTALQAVAADAANCGARLTALQQWVRAATATGPD